MSAKSWQAADSIAIRAPAAEIFRVLREYNRYPEWWGGGYRTRILGGEERVREGSVVQHEVRTPLGTLAFKRKVVGLEENRRIREEYMDGDYRGTGEWALEEAGGSTKVSYTYNGVDHSRRARLIYLLFRKSGHHQFYRRGLKRLKAKVEGGGR